MVTFRRLRSKGLEHFCY
uniref:Uncharacterized protein n=1 Tax=Anguilla anguilla TaxID=7936 RepID=A0A0E9VSN6_ANGAN